MKLNIALIICLLFVSVSSFAQTGLYVPQLAKIDTAMLKFMATYHAPGGQLAITYQGRLVYNRGFGLADTSARDSVYPDNIFRIASVTKPITAIACMQLFEQGQLDLDAQVFGSNGILNDSIYSNILDPLDTTISVRMLLQHSGGWNLNISGDPMFDAYNIATVMGVPSPPSQSVVIQYMLSKRMLDFAPGTEYQYSNFGFCVLGRIIEKITGQSYHDYVTSSILVPLGITDMQLGFNLLSNRLPNEVNYYDFPNAPLAYSIYDNTTLVPWQYGGFNIEFMDSHGGWVASCQDLLKVLCAIDGFNSRPDILTTATIDTMTKASVNNLNYACGIAVNDFNNWWHIGSLSGTTSEIIRDGDSEINWAILVNTRDKNEKIDAAMDNLMWNVLPSITDWPTFDLFTSSGVGDNFQYIDGMTLYPNPASNRMYISFNKISYGEFTVEIYNSIGQNILSNIHISSESTPIDLSNFPDGIYFVRLISNKQNIDVKRFIVMH